MLPDALMSALTLGALCATLAAALLAAALAHRLAGRLAALEHRLRGEEDRLVAFGEALGGELGALRSDERARAHELGRLAREVERLAADLASRALWKADTPSHASAIDAARAGQGAGLLVREHGLSRDEAELLVSLHGRAQGRRAEV